jgi:hypothetical protein
LAEYTDAGFAVAIADDDRGWVVLRGEGGSLAENAGRDWGRVCGNCWWGGKEAGVEVYRQRVQVAETGQAKIVKIDFECFE